MERILINYTRLGKIKFISHLDTMRMLGRAINRACIKAVYSKGFNPHIEMSIAAPLAVGIESNSEYVDVEVEDETDLNEAMESLNKVLPDGIEVKKIEKIEPKMPTSMSVVSASDYIIGMKSKDNHPEIYIDKVLESKEILMNKKTKSGERIVNIRPQIRQIKIENVQNGMVNFDCTIDSGSRSNLNPELLCSAVEKISDGQIYGYPHITRQEIYAEKNNTLYPINEFFSI